MTPASTIGPYRVVCKLGEGGMGAVYRATDTRLNRDVAIKVLPAAFAADPARMQRFEREAQVLASLNHPNIAAIYGVEQGAIVMELVDGDDLRGPLPIDTATAYARQIVAALEAAHEKGIVHRDLKPANIKVSRDGTIKLLDFGLAKATDDSNSSIAAPNPTISPTLSMAMTQAGMILGTAAYMSPEQARGKSVDRRADIWAFGVVFFEMLTGEQTFGTGETVTDVIAAVVTREPDWSKLPPGTPPHLRRLLERCLRKDVKTRLQAIGEARIALDEPATIPPAVSARPQRPWPWITGVLAAALAGVGVGFWSHASRPEPLRPALRLNVEIGTTATLALLRGANSFALSPDGTRLAMVVDSNLSNRKLAVRILQQDQTTILDGTENAVMPFFSPDGEWIAFNVDGKIKKVPVNGGTPQAICSVEGVRGASWAGDAIVLSRAGGGLQRVSAEGGTPADLVKLAPDERTQRWPQYLPDHQLVLFTSAGVSTDYEVANVVAVSLNTGEHKVVLRGAHAARYLPSGHLVFVRGGSLHAVRFDINRLSVSGSAVPILQGVRDSGAGIADYAISDTGIAAFVPGGQSDMGTDFIAWLDQSGKRQEIHSTRGRYLYPRLSPDNRRLAFTGGPDIWIKDLERDTLTRLTFTPGVNIHPVWTPDGKGIFYRNLASQSALPHLCWIPADGSGPAQVLTDDNTSPRSLTPDGKHLAFVRAEGDSVNIFTAAIEGGPSRPRLGKPQPFSRGKAAEAEPRFSPDGKWIAYDSDDSGKTEIFVRPYPGPGGRWQISSGGGRCSAWDQKGSRLFYESPQGIMAVPYTIKNDAFLPGKPALWNPIHPSEGGGRYRWDLAKDGNRIVVIDHARNENVEKPKSQITFVLNFFDELKRKLK